MEQLDYLKELNTTLFKMSKSRLLCDVVIITEDSKEIYIHSLMLAAVSAKLKVAFEQCGKTKRNLLFRLHLSDCPSATVEPLIQFIYTGTMLLQGFCKIGDVKRVLVAGQKLGMDPSKLGLCLATMISMADPSNIQHFPPFIITDEDIYLEMVEKESVVLTAPAIEVIKLTSKVSVSFSDNINIKLPDPDHSYNQKAECSKRELVASTASGLRSKPQIRNNSAAFEDISSATSIDHGTSKGEEIGYMDNEALDSRLDSIPAGSEDMKLLSTILGGIREDAIGIKLEHDSGDAVPELIVECTDGHCDENGVDDTLMDEQSNEIKASANTIRKIKPRVHKLKRRAGVKRGFGLSRLGTKQRVILFCDICGRSFARTKEYAEHRRSHTGERPFSCDLCGKSFVRRRTMIEHRRLHTGERPFMCEVCQKRFPTSGELVKHRRFHTGERPYKCNICGKTFSRCGENADHRRMHAGENVCGICGKEFTRLHNMKEHMTSAHSGEKRFECETCGKSFAYSSGLRYHRRLHKTERPYRCEHCSKSFARAGELSRHERSAHKSQVVEIEIFN